MTVGRAIIGFGLAVGLVRVAESDGAVEGFRGCSVLEDGQGRGKWSGSVG